MSKTIHRVIQLIQELGMSARQFDLSIGASNGYTLRMQKNNASVGTDVIERIVQKYPQINLIWLITGKGEMFIQTSATKNQISDHTLEQLIQNKIAEKLSQEKQELLDDILKEIDSIKKQKK